MNVVNHIHHIGQGADCLVSLATLEANPIITIDAHNHGAVKNLSRLLPGDLLHRINTTSMNINRYLQLGVIK